MGFRKRNRRRKQTESGKSRPAQRGLRFEPLEDRRMLATFVVTNNRDLETVNGVDRIVQGSLRWAVELANATEAADTIVFEYGALFGGTDNGGSASIQLNRLDDLGGTIAITQPLTIYGPAARKLTIQAAPGFRIFDIGDDADERLMGVSIGGVTLAGGSGSNGPDDDDVNGGAIRTKESLTLTEVEFVNNSAGGSGGAIFTELGRTNIDRSLFRNNSAGGTGGAIGNGPPSDGDSGGGSTEGPTARTTITNSTIVGNHASGQFGGGGVANNAGTVIINASTIVANTISGGGDTVPPAGVSGFGNPVAEDEMSDPPAKVNFVYVESSIIWGNTLSSGDAADDIGTVGTSGEGDEEVDLEPAVFTRGANLIGQAGMGYEPDENAQDPADLPPNSDPAFVNYDGDEDGLITVGDVGDFGGALDALAIGTTSKALDKGRSFGNFDQRGVHFTRRFTPGAMPQDAKADVGAYELQQGNFFVDILVDESDLQYSTVYTAVFNLPPGSGPPYTVTISGYNTPGDLSLREALEFADKNPGVDTIRFSNSLSSAPDPTPSPDKTISLRNGLGSLVVRSDLSIVGPTFALEIDATAADPTPAVNAGDGIRVFSVLGSALSRPAVSISNLTVLGGDVAGNGGGLFNSADLTLENMTFTDNNATASGGGVFNDGGKLVVRSSTFNANRAANGGGLYFDDGVPSGASPDVRLTQVTVSGNSASVRGGGIANNNTRLLIEFSTITLNGAASTRGNGIANFGGSAAKTELYSTIVSGNNVVGINNDVEFFFTAGGVNNFQSNGYNLIGAGNGTSVFSKPGDQTSVTNPKLGPLQFAGGLTRVHPLLTEGPANDPGPSKAIDAGNAADISGVGAVPTNDQRGAPTVRVAAGTPGGTARIDIGAYELQGTTYVVDSSGDEDDGIYTQDNLTLREAIKLANTNPLLDTITFSTMISGSNVGSGILITDHLQIIGNGVGVTTINGGNGTLIADNGSASLIDVTIKSLSMNGASSSTGGGAIRSSENLTLGGTMAQDAVVFFSNQSAVGGAAVYQSGGKLTAINVTATANSTSSTGANGGAIYAENAIVDFNGVLLVSNTTFGPDAKGAGLYLLNSESTFLDVTVAGNLTFGAVSRGGGAYVDGGTATFTNSIIAGNTTAGSDSDGAGMYLANATATLNNVIVAQNNTLGTLSAGAGLAVAGGALTINDSQLVQNVTSGLFAPGGGLWLNGGTATITGSTFGGNAVGNGGGAAQGGAIANSGGRLVVRDSTLASNYAVGSEGAGGAIYSDGNLIGTSSTDIVNSTISGNSAARGGGVYNADGALSVRHSTVTWNLASDAGAGLASVGNAATATSVFSSIISANAPDGAASASDVALVLGAAASIQSAGFNLVGTGNGLGTFSAQIGDQIGVNDPKLEQLKDNGGPADPNLPRRYTHRLLDGSPAENAGPTSFNSSSYSPPLNFDQRGEGFARVRGGRIDIGSYEKAGAIIVDTLVDEDDGDFSANDLSLREALGVASAGVGEDLITFAAGLSGGTINLAPALGTLLVNSSVTIDASALAGGLTISAASLDPTPGQKNGDGQRVLTIDDGAPDVYSVVNLTGLTISGGDVTGVGGGVAAYEKVTLSGVTVRANAATDDGGGVYYASDAGFLSVQFSTIEGNKANGSGGGLWVNTDSTVPTSIATISSSTVSGNQAAGDGGGVWNYNGVTVIEYSTITANQAGGAGDGVGSYGDLQTFTRVRSSIIAGNSGPDVEVAHGSGQNSFESLGYNLIGSGAANNDFNNNDQVNVANPGLSPLASNGGKTKTHALVSGSPAIDAGNPSFAGPPTTDQRGTGFARVSNSRIDIGAFESSFLPLPPDFTGDNAVDGADLLVWQRGLGKANPTQADGDANTDGAVNGTDLGIWRSMFGMPATAAVTAGAAATGGAADSAALTSDGTTLASNENLVLVRQVDSAMAGGTTYAPTRHRPAARPAEWAEAVDATLRQFGADAPRQAAFESDDADELAVEFCRAAGEPEGLADALFGNQI